MKDEPSELAAITRDVMKKRKWGYLPPDKPFTDTRPKLYNPPRSSNDNRKRTGPNRRPAREAARSGIIEIRIFDDHEKDPYQGCVRFYGYGPSDYIVYLRRAYAPGVAKRRGGTGRKADRSWYIASIQGTHFDDAIGG